jgi:hypothetical protein
MNIDVNYTKYSLLHELYQKGWTNKALDSAVCFQQETEKESGVPDMWSQRAATRLYSSARVMMYGI